MSCPLHRAVCRSGTRFRIWVEHKLTSLTENNWRTPHCASLVSPMTSSTVSKTKHGSGKGRGLITGQSRVIFISDSLSCALPHVFYIFRLRLGLKGQSIIPATLSLVSLPCSFISSQKHKPVCPEESAEF